MNINLLQAVEDLGDYPGVHADRKVFTYLANHADSSGTVSITQSVIAQGTGVSKTVVSDSVHRLAEKGFLTIEKSVTDKKGTVRAIARNIYHISPWYLVHTKTAKRTPKQCSACTQGCLKVVPDYLSGWKLVPDYREHEGVSYASNTTDDMRRLAQIGEVAADVLKEIFKLYEEKNNK